MIYARLAYRLKRHGIPPLRRRDGSVENGVRLPGLVDLEQGRKPEHSNRDGRAPSSPRRSTFLSMAARRDDARGHRTRQEPAFGSYAMASGLDLVGRGGGASRLAKTAKQCGSHQPGQDRPMLSIWRRMTPGAILKANVPCGAGTRNAPSLLSPVSSQERRADLRLPRRSGIDRLARGSSLCR